MNVLQLATFRVDVTPPVGCGVGFGMGERTTGVRDPLYLRGYLLSAEGVRVLLAVTDWCGLMNGAYRELQAALAEGAGVDPDQVVIHSTHQHDTPLFCFEIESLLGRETFPRPYWRRVLGDARDAARGATNRMRPVREVGHAATRVEGYASARRVIGPDGSLLGNRWSRTNEAAIVAAPEGTIDPLLRTVAFRMDDGEIAASWSFYASHPQVASGRKIYSADAPGEAMRLVTQETGGGEHAFFMGCAGNVTAGKYTSFSDVEGNLLRFGAKLAVAIRDNFAGMSWAPAAGLAWSAASFPFPAEPGKPAKLRAELASSGVPETRKQIVAPVLACMKDTHNATYRLHLLDLGSARVLLMPGEPFVEYQLLAVGLDPARFVAVASNCHDAACYLPRAVSFRQGGYEIDSFCWCTPEIEGLLEGAIRKILDPAQP